MEAREINQFKERLMAIQQICAELISELNEVVVLPEQPDSDDRFDDLLCAEMSRNYTMMQKKDLFLNR
jgi:hypothetical protein